MTRPRSPQAARPPHARRPSAAAPRSRSRRVKGTPMIVSLLTAAVLCAVTAGSAALYLLPVLIGSARRVPDLGAVAVINVLLGWTLAGVGSRPGDGAALRAPRTAGRADRAEPPARTAARPAARRRLARPPAAAGPARLPAAAGPSPAPGQRPGPGGATGDTQHGPCDPHAVGPRPCPGTEPDAPARSGPRSPARPSCWPAADGGPGSCCLRRADPGAPRQARRSPDGRQYGAPGRAPVPAARRQPSPSPAARRPHQQQRPAAGSWMSAARSGTRSPPGSRPWPATRSSRC